MSDHTPVGDHAGITVTVAPDSPNLLASHHHYKYFEEYGGSTTFKPTASVVGELPKAAKPQGYTSFKSNSTSPSESAPLLPAIMKSYSPTPEELVKVGATSAAVCKLIDAEKIFPSEFAKNYVRNLDLSSGYEMLSRLDKDQLHHAKTYLDVRKRAVASFCERAVGHGINQVIFLGDGLDPTSIEVAAGHPDLLVLGIDVNYMAEKQASVNRMGLMNSHYLSGDVTDVVKCLAQLKGAGYNPETPVLVVGQGLFMYMDPEVCKEWQRHFFAPKINKPNHMVFDVHTPLTKNPSREQDQMDQLHHTVGKEFEALSGVVMHRASVLEYFDNALTCQKDALTWGRLEEEVLEEEPGNRQFNHKYVQPPARMIYMRPYRDIIDNY